VLRIRLESLLLASSVKASGFVAVVGYALPCYFYHQKLIFEVHMILYIFSIVFIIHLS
jgi:hypothetical protein